MLSEVERFKGSIEFLESYYKCADSKLFPESSHLPSIPDLYEKDQEEKASLPIEDPEQALKFPRLDKIFSLSLKSQILSTDASSSSSGAAGKPAAAKGKAAPKKEAKKGGGEESSEETVFDRELKDSINRERSILRYRLALLRNWTLNNLASIRKQWLAVIQKLNQWILLAFQSENQSIFELVGSVRGFFNLCVFFRA